MQREIKYSKKAFNGYTTRFKIEFEVKDQEYTSSVDLYSNSDSEAGVIEFVSSRISDKVSSFRVVNKASKQQDNATSKLIKNSLKTF